MKVTKLISILALTGLASAAHALPPSLTFDGFCDGLSGITEVGGGVVAATWNLDACGLPSTGAAGVRSRTASGKGVVGTYDVVTQAIGVAALVIVINDNGTWAYYNAADGSAFNSGTWTAGVAEAGRSNRLSAFK